MLMWAFSNTYSNFYMEKIDTLPLTLPFLQILFIYFFPMLSLLRYLGECVIMADSTTCWMYTAASYIAMDE